MNRKLRLVDASMSDVDELSAAGRRFFTQAYGPHSEPDDLVVHVGQYFGRDAVEAELQKAEITYTVALDGDAIAGFIKLRRGPSPEAIPAADAVEVQQLYVDAERQASVARSWTAPLRLRAMRGGRGSGSASGRMPTGRRHSTDHTVSVQSARPNSGSAGRATWTT